MSDTETRRIFVAIDAGEEAMIQLQRLQADFRESLSEHSGDLRWITPDQFHITLKFLGFTPAYRIPDIKQCLKNIANESTSFSLTLTQWGCFPNPASIRVIWVGPSSDTRRPLQQLHSKIDQRLELLGIEPEHRKFVPHVTFCRVNEDPNDVVSEHYRNYPQSFEVDLSINSFHLYESQTKSSGAIHTILETFELN